MEIVFFIVGAVFAAIGGFVIQDFRRFKRDAVAGKGQVIAYAVRHSRSRQNRSNETYAPVVQYEVHGRSYQFTATVSTSQVKYGIGDTVAILVDKTDPSKARLDSATSTVLGGVFLALGLAAMTAFFFLFRFDALSVGIAAVVLAVMLVKLIGLLNRNNIRSVADLKSKLETLKQSGFAPAEKNENLITDADAFKRHVTRRQKVPVWILAIFLVVGLGVTGGGVYFASKRTEFLHSAATGYGVIVDLHRKTTSSDNGTSTVYYPVVEYTPRSAAAVSHTVRFEHDIGTSHPSYRRGDEVRVLYSPGDPNKAIIDEGWMNYFGPLLMVAIGMIFTIVGASLIVRQRRQKAAESGLKLDF